MYSTRVHHLRIRGHPSRLQSKRGTNTNHCQYPIAVNEIHSTNKYTKKSLISSTLFGDANGAIRVYRMNTQIHRGNHQNLKSDAGAAFNSHPNRAPFDSETSGTQNTCASLRSAGCRSISSEQATTGAACRLIWYIRSHSLKRLRPMLPFRLQPGHG